MVEYREYPPALPLKPFVECLWTLQSSAHFFNKRELIIPGGRAELLFNFSNPLRWFDSVDAAKGLVFNGAQLLGQRNRCFYVESQGEIDLTGVRFRPGGLAPFTAIPVHAFINQIVPLPEIVGNLADTWTHQLFEIAPGKNRIVMLESLLISRMQVDHAVMEALRLIALVKRMDGNESMKQLCEQTGLYYKKMERIFNRYTGYNPKNFSRVVRFYKTLQEMKYSNDSLTGIGLQHGYYDQAHFIKDFKEFTGTPPAQFPFQATTIANLLLKSQLA
jgi:AraC-like DNA-binding protein